MSEREPDDQAEQEEPAAEGDESPEEFAEDIESDPARNPDDPGLDALRGG